MGIKVVDRNGERISFARATGRFFGWILSFLTIAIGFFLAGWSNRKQALHDFIASTLVVRADALPGDTEHGQGTMPITGGVWAGILVLVFPFGLGILAAIAIPAYSDYTIRSKVVELINTAAVCKVALSEHYQANRSMPASQPCPDTGANTGPRITGPGRIEASATGTLETQLRASGSGVTFGYQARCAGDCNGTAITEWVCDGSAGTTIKAKYLPAACR